MKITKTEIKNHIEGKNPIATYYGGLVGLGLEIYAFDNLGEIVSFVESVRTKEAPKKSKFFVNSNGRRAFRWGHRVVWLDECIRTDW